MRSRTVGFAGILCCVVAAVQAGTIRYQPPERTMGRADLIVIGTQTGPIKTAGEEAEGKPAERGRRGPDLFITDFEVKRVVKGSYAEKRIRVLANGFDHPAGWFPHQVSAGDTAALYLMAPGPQRPHWQLVGDMYAKYSVSPLSIEAEAQKLTRKLDELRALKQKALQDMQAHEPGAVRQAKALLPELLKPVPEAKAKPKAEPKPEPRPMAPSPGSRWVPRTGPAWTRLRKAPLPVLRALSILAYLEATIPEIWHAAYDRGSAPSAAEKQAVKRWLERQWPHITAHEALDAFAEANMRYVASFYATFPADNVRPDRLELKPDAATAHSLRFLVDAEDPGCYQFVMTPAWAYWTRMFNARKGEKPAPLFGKMRLPWIKGQVLPWLKPGADPRRRKVALIVMNENPGPWVRAWIQAERARGDRETCHEIIAPAAGLDDPELVAELWLETLRRKGSERDVCWWLSFVRYFHPKVAFLAIERWRANLAVEKGKEYKPVCSKIAQYLDEYRRFVEGEAKGFKSPDEAAAWLRTKFPKAAPAAPRKGK